MNSWTNPSVHAESMKKHVEEAIRVEMLGKGDKWASTQVFVCTDTLDQTLISELRSCTYYTASYYHLDTLSKDQTPHS